MKKKSLSRADKFIPLLRNKNIRTILDVGAGYGHIAERLAERLGAKAYIIEPNQCAADYVTKSGKCTYAGPSIVSLQTDQKFDLVVFSHCLENIVDPVSALTAARNLLSANGHLLIETPNVDWQPSMHIYHPHCYSPGSLTALLAQAGMEIVDLIRSGQPSTRVFPRYITALSRQGSSTLTIRTTSDRRVKLQHWLSEIIIGRGRRKKKKI